MQPGKRIRLASWFRGGRAFLLAIDQAIPRGLHPALLGNPGRWAHGPWDAAVVHTGHVKAHSEAFAGGRRG